MRRIVTVLILSLMLAAGAYAASGDAGLTVKAGTPGFGVDLTLGLGEKVNVRLSGNAFSYTYDDFEFDDDDDELDEAVDTIELTLDLLSVGALVDWHPWGGGFRLSAGAFYNGNEVGLAVDGEAEVEIDDVDYDVTALDGSIDFNTFAPYLGLGWGNAAEADQHWSFAFDLGVMIQGSPDISLTATASDQGLQDQLNTALANEVKSLEDDADSFIVYPVLTLGLSYTF